MWLLVLNNRAGKGRASQRLEKFSKLCREHNQEFNVINETSADATRRGIEKCLKDNDIDVLIAFGGDGLISMCLQLVCSTSTALMVVPTGTGNDFARSLGNLNKSEAEIFHFIRSNDSSKIDAARVISSHKSTWYVQILSSGFDAGVNKLANSIKWPRGKSKYTIALLLALFKFKPISYEIKTDQQTLNLQAMLVVVANGQSYGGGMKILPHSSYEDGMLDLLYVDPVSKFTLLTIFPRVFNGSHINHPKVKTLRSERFEISAKTNAYADGEFVSELPVKVEVIPKSLKTWIYK
jgi:diacylglycerol kinase (ATP)